jgi:hypothetical protein
VDPKEKDGKEGVLFLFGLSLILTGSVLCVRALVTLFSLIDDNFMYDRSLDRFIAFGLVNKLN